MKLSVYIGPKGLSGKVVIQLLQFISTICVNSFSCVYLTSSVKMKLVLVLLEHTATNATVQGFCFQYVEELQVAYSKLGSQTMTEKFVFRTTQNCQVGTALTVMYWQTEAVSAPGSMAKLLLLAWPLGCLMFKNVAVYIDKNTSSWFQEDKQVESSIHFPRLNLNTLFHSL